MPNLFMLKEEDKIILNVGGTKYSCPFRILKTLPNSRLGQLHSVKKWEDANKIFDHYDDKKKEFFFNYRCNLFGEILDCYYNDTLHLDERMCSFDFQHILNYWWLNESNLDYYCYHRFVMKRGRAKKDLKLQEKIMDKIIDEDFGDSDWGEIRHKIWEILEMPMLSKIGKAYNRFIRILCYFYVFVFIYHVITIKHLMHNRILQRVDVTLTLIFTMDYVTRLIVAKNKWKFVCSVANILDLLSFLPYVVIFTATRLINLLLNYNWKINTHILEIITIMFKLLKLMRYSNKIENTIFTVYRSRWEILSAIIFQIIAVPIFSTFMYIFEVYEINNSADRSILGHMWSINAALSGINFGTLLPAAVSSKLLGILVAAVSYMIINFYIFIGVKNYNLTQKDIYLRNILRNELRVSRNKERYNKFKTEEMMCCVQQLLRIVENHLFLWEIEEEQLDYMDSYRDLKYEEHYKKDISSSIIHVSQQQILKPYYKIDEKFKLINHSRLGLIYNSSSVEEILKHCDGFIKEKQEVIFYRNPRFFDVILNFYYTKKLHIRKDCILGIQEELEYWNIDETYLEPCCRFAYFNAKSYSNIFMFRKKEIVKMIQKEKVILYNRLWRLMTDPNSGNKGKVYAIISVTVFVIDMIIILWNNEIYLKNQSIQDSLTRKMILFCCVFFILEYIIRLLVAPKRRNFIISPLSNLEIFCALSTILHLYFAKKFNQFVVFRYVISFSIILRPIKICRYFSIVKYFVLIFIEGHKDIIMILIISATICFLLAHVIIDIGKITQLRVFNGTKPINNYYDAIWYSLFTVVKMGYGNFQPSTEISRIIVSIYAGFASMIVIIMISSLVPLFMKHYTGEDEKVIVVKEQLVLEETSRKYNIGKEYDQHENPTQDLPIVS
ncbi:potassium voltage-gated channel subfamily B member 1-like isoform X2 [Centruroides sculpturatus]|uniref:potassium voltage-gated channel subfamily B member 1-like isoform X2 n=1 Tax=Centruroides sculpturatus TaxID=218467 RepID=UPI000C6E727F|nr:potassium voltage-gated channel subfamily B member 1-like isoform X2 [Centruroides sculpturatus]